MTRASERPTRRAAIALCASLLILLAACAEGSSSDASQSDDDASRVVAAPSTTTTSTTTTTEPPPPLTAEEVNEELGRGINIGNALEAPREGEWGPVTESSFFDAIAEAGFDHVRLPVSFAGYADADAPYTIPLDDPTMTTPGFSSIWERVDWAIAEAERTGLWLILDMHHYDELHADPVGHGDRFVAIWSQISEYYADAGDHVVLELLNEPQGQFNEDPALWNDLLLRALAEIRVHHPDRQVIIGGVESNGVDALTTLELPEDDRNIIATVHVYAPFEFTHQGAPWVPGDLPTGITWGPDYQWLPIGVRDVSWDSTVRPESSGVAVSFDTQWSAFAFDLGRPIDAAAVTFVASGNTTLRLVCRTDPVVEGAEFALTETSERYEIDTTVCPAESTGIGLMDTTPDPSAMRISAVELCAADGQCDPLFTTQLETLEGYIDRAASWGLANDRPIYMGEFGAFSANGESLLVDRAAWTAAAQRAARDADMSTGYWALHSGFGAYDPATGSWIPELLEALIG